MINHIITWSSRQSQSLWAFPQGWSWCVSAPSWKLSWNSNQFRIHWTASSKTHLNILQVLGKTFSLTALVLDSNISVIKSHRNALIEQLQFSFPSCIMITMTMLMMQIVLTMRRKKYPLLFLSKTLKASLMSSSRSVSLSFLAIIERNSSKSISPLPSLSTCLKIIISIVRPEKKETICHLIDHIIEFRHSWFLSKTLHNSSELFCADRSWFYNRL